MIWFRRWRARRNQNFEREVLTEMTYLLSAHPADPLAAAEHRQSARQEGAFTWFVIEEAARRLSRRRQTADRQREAAKRSSDHLSTPNSRR